MREVLFSATPKRISIVMIRYGYSFLNALVDIFKSFEFVQNHPMLKEHAQLVEIQSNTLRRMVDECTRALESLLKGEKALLALLLHV